MWWFNLATADSAQLANFNQNIQRKLLLLIDDTVDILIEVCKLKFHPIKGLR